MKTDLKNGILDLDGYLLKPETTWNEFKEHFGEFPFEMTSCNLFFNIYQIEFSADGTIDSVEFSPVVPEKEDYACVCRRISEKWLREQLGEPLPNNSDTSQSIIYKFPTWQGGFISLWNDRDGYWSPNRIVLDYKLVK